MFGFAVCLWTFLYWKLASDWLLRETCIYMYSLNSGFDRRSVTTEHLPIVKKLDNEAHHPHLHRFGEVRGSQISTITGNRVRLFCKTRPMLDQSNLDLICKFSCSLYLCLFQHFVIPSLAEMCVWSQSFAVIFWYHSYFLVAEKDVHSLNDHALSICQRRF